MNGPITPGLEPQPPIAPQVPSPRKRMHLVFGCIGIVLGVFAAFFRAWIWSYGTMNAEVFGYAIGGAVLPGLIAYAIAGHKKVRNFGRFGMWFGAISVVFLATSGSRPTSLKEHVADLMKEAAGTKGVDRSSPSTLDKVMRNMMRDILEDRKNFERETEPFAKELATLYGAATFSSKPAMQSSIDAVRGIAAADERYSQRLEGIPERVQAIVDRSNLAASDKRDFMGGIRKSYGNVKTLQIRREAMGVEKQWADATVALYEFGITNASRVRLDGDHLVIGNEGVRTEFNARLEKAQAFRDELSKRNAELEDTQRAVLQDAGVTMKDLGLPDIEPKKK